MEQKEHKEKKVSPGIVYLSKIPPSMNPLKIRSLLLQFGKIGRVYLQAEDESKRKNRKKFGGTSRKQFTEGWVEFLDKKVAKSVAQSLNCTNIGGKKRYYYHDDIWNIKYLPKFKWGHISEKLAYEKAAREQRMRAEISQAKKEANFYLENVSKGKAISAIVEKKRRKRKLQEKNDVSSNVERNFNQKSVKLSKTDGASDLSTNILSKVFSTV
ncbi:uncharacterized protein LOC100197622 isoform X2 [Hydra vulgaris]|uniref:Activator of basal transcription 1 n=1 Tax=Hydra vulgaris TaxID=6087 RepID=A0ABM4D1W5_HYDVU